MKKKTVAIAIFVACAIASAGNAISAQPSARSSFNAVPAVGNIGALDHDAVFATPAVIPQEIRPGIGIAHALGQRGYIWKTGDSSVCVFMDSGTGSCFAEFNKPVVLYLTGSQDRDGTYLTTRAEGVLPDSVKRLTLVLSNGRRVVASVTSNSFAVDLPPGRGISGYDVTLVDGAQFYTADTLDVPDVASRFSW